MSIEVSVLIVSYKCRNEILDCLASLHRSHLDDRFEIIVVDNDSQDGTSEAIEHQFPDVYLHREPTNIGFARGVNRAAEFAQGEFLLLLNPDTVVLDDAIAEITRFARAHPEHVAYGGRTLAPDGHVDVRSAWRAPSLWSSACFAVGLDRLPVGARWFDPERMADWRRDSVRTVDIITGCFLLIRRSDWDRLGGFDPTYFLYGEDADLALRIRANGGTCIIDPDAVIVHTVGASSGHRSDKMQRVLQGRATLFRHHWPRWQSTLGVAALQAGAGVRALGEHLWRTATPSVWTHVWRTRRDWRTGFPDAAHRPTSARRVDAIDRTGQRADVEHAITTLAEARQIIDAQPQRTHFARHTIGRPQTPDVT